MNNNVKKIPEGYHSITPYLALDDAKGAIEFYKKAFGAKEIYRLDMGGKIMHAEIQIGDSRIMLSDENPEWGSKSAKTIGGSPVSLMIYVEDVDSLAKRALEAGAKEEMKVEDQFYGDRSGTFQDPFGLSWTISTHKEDVSEDEIRRRAEKMFASKKGAA